MAPSHSDLQAAPAPAQLAALARAIRPGAAVESAARLEGGVDNGMHVIVLRRTSGERERVVLRRYGDEPATPPVERARLEWRLLGLLERAGVAAPRRVHDDSDGSRAGTPSIVITWIPGKPVHDTEAVPDWHGQLARALDTLHSVNLSVHDVSFLGDSPEPAKRVLARTEPPSRVAAHPLGAALWDALRAAATSLQPGPRVLVHADLWPGNTLWLEGKLQALVDWDGARLADPALDVANLWMELSLAGRGSAGDRFVETYRASSGRPLANLHFYALLALTRPLPDPAIFMSGSAISAENLRQHLSRAIHSALARSASWRAEPRA